MNKIATTSFRSRIVREYSSSPRPDELGEHDSTMTLYGPNGPDFNNHYYYMIEWDIPGADEVVHYGIWTEHKVVTDYDGGFSLPMQAIQLLRDNGITVPVEFE